MTITVQQITFQYRMGGPNSMKVYGTKNTALIIGDEEAGLEFFVIGRSEGWEGESGDHARILTGEEFNKLVLVLPATLTDLVLTKTETWLPKAGDQ